MSHTDNSAARYDALMTAKRDPRIILLWQDGTVEGVIAMGDAAPPAFYKTRLLDCEFKPTERFDPNEPAHYERVEFLPTTLVDSGGRLIYLEKQRG